MTAYTNGWVHNLPPNSDVPSDAPRVIGVAIALAVLATVFTAIRWLVRVRYHTLGLDDWAGLTSLMLGIGYSAVAVLQTRWGLGLKPTDVPMENILTFSKIQYAGGPLYCLAVAGFKLSLLLSYLRLSGNHVTYVRFLYGAIALICMNQIIFACLLSFACSPIHKQWEPDVPGHCINTVASYFALAGTSLGLDLMVIALPFPVLFRLNLSREKKMFTAALFALGFFITVIQIIRIFAVENLADYTNSQKIIIWSVIEIHLGVVLACIPTYGQVLRWIHVESRKHIRSAYNRSSPDNGVPGRLSFRGVSKVSGSASEDQDRLWDDGGIYSSNNTVQAVATKQSGPRTTQTNVSDDGVLRTHEVTIEFEDLQRISPPKA